MAIYEKLIVTDAGRRLLEKVYLNNKIEFTKMTTFEKVNYEEPNQDILVSSFSFDNSNKVLNVTACLTNRDLTDGYYLNSVGLYANDPDEGEILFAYINAVRADYITAFDSKIGETLLDITFSIKVSATDNFQVVIPEQAYALANHEHFVKDIKFENNDVRLDNYLETMDNSVSKNTKDIEQIKEQGVQVADTIPPKDNLLVNSDFQSGIINQKGILSYVNQNAYTIDMWQVLGSGRLVLKNVVDVQFYRVDSLGGTARFRQILENQQKGTYTFTVNIKTTTSKVKMYILNENDEMIEQFVKNGINSMTYTGTIKEVGMIIYEGESESCYFNYLKLEKGTKFTGMPYWDRVTEILRCRRRMYNAAPKLTYGLIGEGYAIAGNQARIFINLPVSLAKSPSINFNGDFQIWTKNGAFKTTAITVNNGVRGIQQVAIDCTINSSSFTIGDYALLRNAGVNTNIFIIDAYEY